MLYHFLYPLSETYPYLNLFKYITFRTGGATLTALALSLAYGKPLIAYLRKVQGKGQPIRSDGPQTHFAKQGTPTIGGVLIILSVLISVFLWADLTNPFIHSVVGVFAGFGLIGFADDYAKIKYRNSKGVPGKIRLLFGFLISSIAAWWICVNTPEALQTGLAIPLFKDLMIPLGFFFIPFAAFVTVGTANAVNLTDGLDGLASGSVIIAAGAFAIIAYLVGHSYFANYLKLYHILGSGELALFCGALIGACMGFLWFNAPPAEMFMGDTGSLALGGALGVVAVATKHEIVLMIIGGMFVAETVSVILQVAGFKMTGQRLFRMAPLHHHFEKKGWPETKVVIRFWILSVILALIGLSTLKVR